MKQSRLMSLHESVSNTAFGFALSLVCQFVFLVMIEGLPMTLWQNLRFAIFMTAVSIGRNYVLRRHFERKGESFAITPFEHAVLAERRRQTSVEGYSRAHDDAHEPGELARAGAAYLYAGAITDLAQRDALTRCWRADGGGSEIVRALWQWDWGYWKPKVDDRRRDLVRGTALGMAEGDRFDRMRKRSRRAA